MNPRALATAFLMAGTLYVLAPAAQAQAPGSAYTEIDCNVYAEFAQRMAFHRMVESRLELVIRQVYIDAGGQHTARAQAFAREARTVYAEGLPPSEARFQAFKRCTAVLGRFGMEV